MRSATARGESRIKWRLAQQTFQRFHDYRQHVVTLLPHAIETACAVTNQVGFIDHHGKGDPVSGVRPLVVMRADQGSMVIKNREVGIPLKARDTAHMQMARRSKGVQASHGGRWRTVV